MTTALDVRLNYGSWPPDDADSSQSAVSPEASPAFNFAGSRMNNLQHQYTPRWQQSSSDRLLSDALLNSENNINSDDFLEAETNMGASASTPRNIAQQPQASRWVGGHNNFIDSEVIDLTDSPPEHSARPPTVTWNMSPPTLPSWRERSPMRPFRPSDFSAQRQSGGSSPPPRTEESPRKRRRLFLEPPAGEQSQSPDTVNPSQVVDAIDLTGVNNDSEFHEAVAKYQPDAYHMQVREGQGHIQGGRTPLTTYKCPICMDTPEDATSTVCGHLFCHKCIIETLRFSEAQRRHDAITAASAKTAKGTCPVCRKPLARKDEPGNGRALVPLEIKVATRRDLKGKGVAGREVLGVADRGGGKGGQFDPAPASAPAAPAATIGAGAATTAATSSGLAARLSQRTKQQQRLQREGSADMWRDLTTLEHA